MIQANPLILRNNTPSPNCSSHSPRPGNIGKKKCSHIVFPFVASSERFYSDSRTPGLPFSPRLSLQGTGSDPRHFPCCPTHLKVATAGKLALGDLPEPRRPCPPFTGLCSEHFPGAASLPLRGGQARFAGPTNPAAFARLGTERWLRGAVAAGDGTSSSSPARGAKDGLLQQQRKSAAVGEIPPGTAR